MKNKLYILIALYVVLLGCETEDTRYAYKTVIRNESQVSVEIEEYSNEDLISNFIILPYSSSQTLIYISTSFKGYFRNSDSVVFKFANQKGYSCTINRISGDLCFNSKNPLDFKEPSYFKVSDFSFDYIITQEDAENALELH